MIGEDKEDEVEGGEVVLSCSDFSSVTPSAHWIPEIRLGRGGGPPSSDRAGREIFLVLRSDRTTDRGRESSRRRLVLL